MIELQPFSKNRRHRNVTVQPGSPATTIAGVLVVLYWLAMFFLVFPAIGSIVQADSLQCLLFLGVMAALAIGTIAINVGIKWLWKQIVRVKVGEPIVRASSQTIERGQRLDVTYEQPVNQQMALQSIVVRLERYEWVKWTAGTDTHTKENRATVDEERFSEKIVKAGGTIRETARFTVPDDAMHTFDHEHNQVRWFLVVEVNIRAWPDFYEQYELMLNPGGTRISS